jgi:uncharacterized membrane protein
MPLIAAYIGLGIVLIFKFKVKIIQLIVCLLLLMVLYISAYTTKYERYYSRYHNNPNVNLKFSSFIYWSLWCTLLVILYFLFFYKINFARI